MQLRHISNLSRMEKMNQVFLLILIASFIQKSVEASKSKILSFILETIDTPSHGSISLVTDDDDYDEKTNYFETSAPLQRTSIDQPLETYNTCTLHILDVKDPTKIVTYATKILKRTSYLIIFWRGTTRKPNPCLLYTTDAADE